VAGRRRAGAALERLKGSPPVVFTGEGKTATCATQLAKRDGADARSCSRRGDCVESLNELLAMRIRGAREDHDCRCPRANIRRHDAGREAREADGPVTKPRSRLRACWRRGDPRAFRGTWSDDARTADDRRRIPEPLKRMVEVTKSPSATLNLCGVHQGWLCRPDAGALWNKDFGASSPEGQGTRSLAGGIESALAFMARAASTLTAEGV